jgi:RNA-directed DNA polymerase
MKRHEQDNQQDLVDNFCSMSSLSDVAKLLKVKPSYLSFVLYKLNGGRNHQYKNYEIKKKTGGLRKISAPDEPLRELQQKLYRVLQVMYWERPSAHGFIKKRSIKTNARQHTKKRYVLNLDLDTFFPSINFGRVRGLFMAEPYKVEASAATILAQIICHEGALPQGGVTSPIISNMICSKLDGALQVLAKNSKCIYSRYADDITFSTNMSPFPTDVFDQSLGKVSDNLEASINGNGFTINKAKVRLQHKVFRQEVTGLIVNRGVNVKRTYIRTVRATLHAWGKFGLVAAEKQYKQKYCPHPDHYIDGTFKKVLRGKIEFIKSIKIEDHLAKKSGRTQKTNVHLKLLDHYHINCLREFSITVIRSEGKTDWMHMAAALRRFKEIGKFQNLNIDFYKTKDHFFYGDANLKAFCEKVKNGFIKEFENPVLCVFDCDRSEIIRDHTTTNGIKSWTGNVHSILIPSPRAFQRQSEFSIEFLHRDDVLAKEIKGRRLYFSNEFLPNRVHRENSNIFYNANLPTGPYNKILSQLVYEKRTNKSLALSKNDFARAVYLREPGFDKIEFDGFEPLFEMIEYVVKSQLKPKPEEY